MIYTTGELLDRNSENGLCLMNMSYCIFKKLIKFLISWLESNPNLEIKIFMFWQLPHMLLNLSNISKTPARNQQKK